MRRDELDLVLRPGLAEEIHEAADILRLARLEGGDVLVRDASGGDRGRHGDRHGYGEQQGSEKTKQLLDALQSTPLQLASGNSANGPSYVGPDDARCSGLPRSPRRQH